MKKLLILVPAIIIILGVLLFFFFVKPALQLKNDLIFIQIEANSISSALQGQNLNEAESKVVSTKEKLSTLKIDYQKLAWVGKVPFVNKYYQDGLSAISAGHALADAAAIGIESIQPYADILGFQGKGGAFGEMTAEKRLTVALDTLEKIEPNLDKINEKLNQAKTEVDKIDASRYPATVQGKPVRAKVQELKTLVSSLAGTLSEIKPAISFLRPLMGIPSEKRYLLLFQNDAELRPTGGFLTAYAVLSVNNGNFKPLGSYDIYSLDAKFGDKLKAPAPITKYLDNVFSWHLRDMNLSPDFKVSMDTFLENYGKVQDRGTLNGVIAIDTKVLVDLLRILGPIGVSDWGNFSAENDKRCNCPQVFYELELQADKPVSTIKTDRKAMLGPLMQSILMNVMQSPKKKWPEFFNTFFTAVQEKHLLMYFFDPEIQKATETLNASGRIQDYEGDYFHLNDTNFGGAKSNMYIKQNVVQDIKVDANGEVTKTITIDYRNPAPPSNCNLEAGQLCLNGLYKDWVRLYVPKGSQLVSSTGSEVEVTTSEDLGKTVFEAYYGKQSPLRPEGKAQLTFTYKLPFKIQKGQEYKLLIQKQPGTYDNGYTINYNSKETDFALTTDKEIKL